MACCIAVLVVVAGSAGSEAAAGNGKSLRTKVDRIAIADVPFKQGNRRIGVEVRARYRPDAVTAGAAGFRYRVIARVKAIVGGKAFSADPEPDARLDGRLLSPLRLEHHLFFSRSDSRRIRSGLSSKQVRFSAATTYSVDRNQDGQSDATAQDLLQDASPNQVTPPDTGGTDLGSVSDPCSQAENRSVCQNVPSLPKTTTHFWDTASLSPNCPAGTQVIDYQPDVAPSEVFPYRIDASPSNLDRHTTDLFSSPILKVTDDNLHHPVQWTATYACTPSGR